MLLNLNSNEFMFCLMSLNLNQAKFQLRKWILKYVIYCKNIWCFYEFLTGDISEGEKGKTRVTFMHFSTLH